MERIVVRDNLVPVPPELASEYGLHEGSRVEWTRTEGGAWTLRPAMSRQEAIRKFRGMGKGQSQSGVESFLRWREEERRLDETI